MSKPVVAMVGRPNVGKSTLFNRIIGERKAIVESKPGVTRDRLYQEAEWNGTEFMLIDTGGMEPGSSGNFIDEVCKQAYLAINECEIIMFLVDARAGITPVDEEIAAILRSAGKPVILIANKVENFLDNTGYMEFYKLGLGEPVPVSAAQGFNSGDLLDMLVAGLPRPVEEDNDVNEIDLAVIGRPNVGKSSLVNMLLGEDRVIVSHVPGTTRDAIDTFFYSDQQSYKIVDTAGIRRRSRIKQSTERFSISRSFKAVNRCEIALMMIDAVEGVTDQDKRIAGYAHDRGKASIILINKWDLPEKDEKAASRFIEHVRSNLPFMSYAPILFISCLTGRGMNKVLDMVNYVADQAALRVSTSQLNKIIEDAVLHNPPPARKGKSLKIYYATQGGVNPPTFLLFCNNSQLVHFSYLRYLENQFRNVYGFEGTPMKLVFREREKSAFTK
ncbi:MAG: ribosome biogenesis GTPase Der [Clostridiales bacterium]|nr:ribosome biogenesis GTPase Der [Clostridiales bacterium]MCF8023232.1 ribosome biogenesis GTPase Der [Clostridiales bacterium]